MRIGALSALTGLSRDTIRFYERQGLIASAAATGKANTYRHYGDDLPERLRMITDARSAGMSVADLKLLLTFMESGDPGAININEFLDQRISQVEDTIRQSRKLLKTLKLTRAALVVPMDAYSEDENR
ncbi:MAG: MerR family transcriptional regulator [Paracoccaceae bacterium]